MIGILPEADDWSERLPDGRLLCIGKHEDSGIINLNCVLQRDSNTQANSHAHFIIVHQLADAHDAISADGVDSVLAKFIDESNEKLSKLNIKPAAPVDVIARLKWHFRWSLSYDSESGKILFKVK